VECGTKRKFADIGERISAQCRDASFRSCAALEPAIRFHARRDRQNRADFRAIRRAPCSKFSIRDKKTPLSIATSMCVRFVANHLHRDRELQRGRARTDARPMEVISLPGYTEREKLEIAKRYLVRRQMEENG